MNTQYRIVKGSGIINELLFFSGITGVYRNPHGAGENIVEIVHTINPDTLPEVVKDRTIGNIILADMETRK